MLVALSGQVPQRLLDLTRQVEDETKSAADRTFTNADDPPCPGKSTGRLDPAPTLALFIERLNSTEYSMGGQIIVDLRVTNTGNQALPFPWVRLHEFRERAFFEGPEALQVGLRIAAIDAAGQEHGLAGAILRGSRDQPGTLQSIAPGETIAIRFPSGILGVDGPGAPVHGNGQLFATLSFRDGECRTWQPVRSQGVKIRLR
jgi:hypothetical protein